MGVLVTAIIIVGCVIAVQAVLNLLYSASSASGLLRAALAALLGALFRNTAFLLLIAYGLYWLMRHATVAVPPAAHGW